MELCRLVRTCALRVQGCGQAPACGRVAFFFRVPRYDNYIGVGQLAESRHAKFPDFQPRYHANSTKEMAAEFAKIANKYSIAPAQLALAWAAAREYMGSVIIGATSMAQLKENIAAFDITIPKECEAELEKVRLYMTSVAGGALG